MGLLGQVRRGRRPAALTPLVGLGLLVSLAAGCVGMKPLLWTEDQAKVPCQADSRWEQQVVYASDPTHGGVQTPGLAGRLYLFGPEPGKPLVGDGSLVVDLFDETPVAKGGQPKLLERWCIDKDTLKRLARNDFVGPGYTLFLPWGTYRPDIAKVHLTMCYSPQKGTPLYAPSRTIALNTDAPSIQVANRLTVPRDSSVVQTAYSAGAGPAAMPSTPVNNGSVAPAMYPGNPAAPAPINIGNGIGPVYPGNAAGAPASPTAPQDKWESRVTYGPPPPDLRHTRWQGGLTTPVPPLQNSGGMNNQGGIVPR
jgi:hypothetical protein